MNPRRQSSIAASKAAELLGRMTLIEKIAQLNSCWIQELQTDGHFHPQKIRARLGQGIGQITRLSGGTTLDPQAAAKMANTIQHQLVEHTRLGIPAIFHEECCAGSMTLGATAYPQMLGLASSFEPQLAERMTAEIRRQLRALGAHQGLAPVLDVARDPRWGRVEETFGEDPLLVSQFGVHYIRGLQSDDLRQGVMATGKHFVGHSLSQGGLNCAPVQLGWRTLWEVYLMPFQAAIREAGLASMMNAYPELDGEVVAASGRILTDLLRGKLGFDGVVVSDYEAVMMIHSYHHMAPDLQSAAALGLRAGIDVELPTAQCYNDSLVGLVESGKIPLEWVDQAVQRHLQMKFELGLFDNPYVPEEGVLDVFETAEQRALALEIARKSLVLLSNQGVLPLAKTVKSLAVIGPNADDPRNLLGDYSYAAVVDLLDFQKPADSSFEKLDRAALKPHEVRVVTVRGALERHLPKTQILYAKGCDVFSEDRTGFEAAVRAAEQAEAVVLVLGDKPGLTLDSTCGETRDSADLRLPGVQEDLARAVLAVGKPVVVVLINGRPLAIPELVDAAGAVLEAWSPGEEGGTAVAEALVGDFNPGGKLTMTFPRSVGQLPVFYNNKPAGLKSNWYVNYVTESIRPLFPFGHGLSYTTFEYSDASLHPAQAQAGETVEVRCTVKNTGAAAGDEVVQLYCHDLYGSTPRPVKELKGFARVSLQPGESRQVSFQLPVNLLAFYDENLDLVVEAGPVEVMLASSSEDIRFTSSLEITGAAKTPIAQRLFGCEVQVS